MRKHIVYLASGSSRRFGENKLFFPVDGKPMYLWGLEMLRAVYRHRNDRTLTVVSRYEAIRETAESLGLRAVDSPDSEKGLSYTIRAGIAALGEISPEDYLLFVVADQPHLAAASVERLLTLAEGAVECASLCCGDRPGNPTLFSAALIPELLDLEGDTGGRSVLRRHNCRFVQAGSLKELEDIDRPQDIQRIPKDPLSSK